MRSRIRLHLPQGPAVVDLVIVVGLLALGWVVVFVTGGTRSVGPHVFYVPILVVALRRSMIGALSVAVAAGLLVGPLMPLNTVTGEAQTVANWIARLAAFVVIAAVASRIQSARRAASQDALTAAIAERDLAVQRASMVQILSHELRTPLTVIKGSLAMLRQVDDQARRDQFLVAMDRASRRLEGLATVVQASTRTTWEIGLETTDLRFSTVLEDAVASLSGAHDLHRVRIRIHADDELLHTVPDHLRVALCCLLDNALRFSPATAPVEVTATRTQDLFEVAIRDYGPGIHPADTTELFEAFRQGDQTDARSHEGLGLGLYAARRIISQLGGTVDLEPAAGNGGGAIAHIRIPLSIDDAFTPVGRPRVRETSQPAP